jgi:hypothetical protein
LKLNEALPTLFRRPFPVLESGTRVLLAGTLLDTPRRDILKIATLDENMGRFSEKKDEYLVFSGYTLIAKLLEIDQEEYYRFLYQPCEQASITTRPVDSNVELATIFDQFVETGFGWSLVEEEGKFDVVSLADFIPLYQNELMQTDLTVPDVASQQIFSMPRDTGLKKALQEMMNKSIRRIFLSGTNSKFVSDREILTYIFSPERLNVVREDPSEMLEATLEDVESMEAIQVEGRPTIKKISYLFKPESGAWCLLCANGLVTPWDLVIKPWNMRRLKIRENVS